MTDRIYTSDQTIDYPNVLCDRHPKQIEPGYMVCNHIQSSNDIRYVERATKSILGVVACEECHRRMNNPDYAMEHFRISCVNCLKENGLLAEVQ